MISRRPVTDALLAKLRGTGEKCGDGIAPPDAGQRYWTLEPIDAYPEGGLEPEKTIWFGFRVRSVGVAPAGERSGSRMDAEYLADTARALLLNRAVKIEGTGWRIIGRRLESSSTDFEGPTTNVIEDYVFCTASR